MLLNLQLLLLLNHVAAALQLSGLNYVAICEQKTIDRASQK